MKPRLRIKNVQPEAYKVMNAFEKYLSTTSIEPIHHEFIRIRASQINGCAYCVDAHSRDARNLGETQQRINLISVWREAENLFTEEERTILAMTEEITLISQHGLSDKTYEKAIELFGEEKTAQIIMAVITINAWTRIGVSTKMQPAPEVEKVS